MKKVKWEYKIHPAELDPDDKSLQRIFDDFGKEGWELATYEPFPIAQ